MAPVRRYQRDRPGELLHLDIKKLARFEGVGHRLTGDRRGRSEGMGYDYRMSRSTTPPAWPMSKSCPTKENSRPRASSSERSAGSEPGVEVERVMIDFGIT